MERGRLLAQGKSMNLHLFSFNTVLWTKPKILIISRNARDKNFHRRIIHSFGKSSQEFTELKLEKKITIIKKNYVEIQIRLFFLVFTYCNTSLLLHTRYWRKCVDRENLYIWMHIYRRAYSIKCRINFGSTVNACETHTVPMSQNTNLSPFAFKHLNRIIICPFDSMQQHNIFHFFHSSNRNICIYIVSL